MRKRLLRWSLTLALIVYLLPIGFSVASYHVLGNEGKGWWEAERTSADQAPDPAQNKDAIIQVYAARTARWRGTLGVHTWIAVKPQNAASYTRIEVFGFHLRRYGNTVSLNQRSPDTYWFGNTPTLLREIRGGGEVDDMIERLYEAAENYPYDKHYRLWPGPNSNTFIAWLGRSLPELKLELPATAIGKDFLPGGALFARTPSNTGVQFSLGGAFGLLVGVEEGVEVNLLGFSAGIDFLFPAVKLPGVGRIGVSDFKSTHHLQP